jgi:hypothetical protein
MCRIGNCTRIASSVFVDAKCFETARRSGGAVMTLPVVLNENHMDFPGTVSFDMELQLNVLATCVIRTLLGVQSHFTRGELLVWAVSAFSSDSTCYHMRSLNQLFVITNI